MEPEGSLPNIQQPATCSYPELDRSSLCIHPTSRRSILILSSHLRIGLPSDLLTSSFPSKTVYAPLLSPIRATCPRHFIRLDLITEIILVGSTQHKAPRYVVLPQC